MWKSCIPGRGKNDQSDHVEAANDVKIDGASKYHSRRVKEYVAVKLCANH